MKLPFSSDIVVTSLNMRVELTIFLTALTSWHIVKNNVQVS